MPRINILDDLLVSQIAAGEVVERPASVVKELIENAIDAGAARIRVELQAGGRRRIRVSDDGSGMGRDDALLAFDRHATSKISSFEDLQHVGTLGFRGEALSSIAAVAKVELTTAVEPGQGQRVRIEAGRIRSVEPAPHPRGTRVDVASLFSNVPARREFLKSPRTELRRCVEIVQGYALARPDLGFTLHHEGRLLLEAPPAAGEESEGARRRIAEIFGEDLAAHLVEIVSPRAAAERIWGFVGDRFTTRGRRYFTFVNRRLLRDRALMATFYRAVREEWRSEEFPALFVFLDLPAEAVDVNVHPQKAEVRFRDSAQLERLARALAETLRRALGEAPAPLRPSAGRPPAGLVWQGVGGGLEGADRDAPVSSSLVRDGPSPGDRSPAKLADVAYAPLEPRPVPLSGRRGEPRPFSLLGQYKGSLLLLEGPDGLYLVDQHAAHERILYERLRRATAAERPVAQAFVEPLVLELGPAEGMRLAELREELEACGFSLSELSGSHWVLRSAPAALSPDEAERLVVQLAGEPESSGGGESTLRQRLLHALSATLSCRAAIKIHHPLTPQEMTALVDELFASEQPFACPHGRPVVLKMTDADLERRFGRR